MSQSRICNLDKMQLLAKEIALSLKPGDIVTLSGDLGAGKTTFTKMLCKALGIDSIVSSPTFTYLNIYEEKVAHFDLYRLKNGEDFFALGFDEFLDGEYIAIIEWPEIVLNKLAGNIISLTFTHHQQGRKVTKNDSIYI